MVSANASSAANAIDPAVFQDAGNNLWLTYGSYFGSIRIARLDATTGKPLDLSTQYAVANGGVEASYVAHRNNYYYLFVNRGTCCQGVGSTYHIQVGRSATPGGPYLDQAGADLNTNGGTTLLSTAGRFVGPGRAFLPRMARPTSAIITTTTATARPSWASPGSPGAPATGRLSAATGCPGRYTIANQNSGLVWDAWGCTGASGQMVAQGTPAGLACQQWDLKLLGAGAYKITNALGGLAVDVIDCSPDAGALLQLFAANGLPCQQYRLDRASDGSYVFASANGNRVVEVPFASKTAGAQLGLWDYNGCTCQRWLPTQLNTATATAGAHGPDGVHMYPVPAEQGRFTVALDSSTAAAPTTVEIFACQAARCTGGPTGPSKPIWPWRRAWPPAFTWCRCAAPTGW